MTNIDLVSAGRYEGEIKWLFCGETRGGTTVISKRFSIRCGAIRSTDNSFVSVEGLISWHVVIIKLVWLRFVLYDVAINPTPPTPQRPTMPAHVTNTNMINYNMLHSKREGLRLR